MGLASIGPLFRTIQQAKQTIEQARNRLEQEVRQRTAELVRADEELQAEFAQRAKAEEALRDEHRKFRHIVRLNERDQQLLAYDIHDGFVQPATAALMTLQAGLAAYKTEPDKTLEHVVLALQLLQESMSQVRWLISGLRPVILKEQGLVAAIDKLVDDTAGCTEIRIEWLHRVEFDRLAPTLEMSLFRIIQEALRNAVRHSGTNRIEIALIQSGGSVKATIRDWGGRLRPQRAEGGPLRIEGHERAGTTFGGTAQIGKLAGGALATRVGDLRDRGVPAPRAGRGFSSLEHESEPPANRVHYRVGLVRFISIRRRVHAGSPP